MSQIAFISSSTTTIHISQSFPTERKQWKELKLQSIKLKTNFNTAVQIYFSDFKMKKLFKLFNYPKTISINCCQFWSFSRTKILHIFRFSFRANHRNFLKPHPALPFSQDKWFSGGKRFDFYRKFNGKNFIGLTDPKSHRHQLNLYRKPNKTGLYEQSFEVNVQNKLKKKL